MTLATKTSLQLPEPRSDGSHNRQ